MITGNSAPLFTSFLSLSILVSTALAQSLDWQQVFPPHTPVTGYSSAMVYDEARSQVVLATCGTANVLMWRWTGSDWTQMTSPTAPPAREYFGFAYDAARQQVVLFGGRALNDTWIWDGTAWTQKALTGGPRATSNSNRPAMAYDRVRQVTVLYDTYGETWLWDGSSWQKRNPSTSPPVRTDGTAVFDESSGKVLLYGGKSYSPSYGVVVPVNDAWWWDGTTWTYAGMGTGNYASGAEGAGMAYHRGLQQVVTYGGTNYFCTLYAGNCPGHDLNATGVWDSGAIRDAQASNPPPARYDHAMVYDPGTNRLMVFGGTGSHSAWNDTWIAGPAVRTFSLLVTVNNVVGNVLPAANQGRVTLYRTSDNAQMGAPLLTNINRQVTFSGVAPGSYYYRVENLGGAFGNVEYWGQKSVSISSADLSDSFTRNQPYLTALNLYDNATSMPIPIGSTVRVGTVVRVVAQVAGAGGAATGRLLADRDQSGPYDSDTTCSGTPPLSCVTQTMSSLGSYSVGFALTSGGAVTDNWTWQPAFAIATSVLLPVPYYYQGPTSWCAYTSMSMLLNYHGSPRKPYEVASDFGVGPTEGLVVGSNLQRIWNYFSGFGYDADIESWKPTLMIGANLDLFINYISSSVFSGRPVWFAIDDQHHAMVATGVDANGIYIHDPSGYVVEQVRPNDTNFVGAYLTWPEFRSLFTVWWGGWTEIYTIVLDRAPAAPRGPITLDFGTGGTYPTTSGGTYAVDSLFNFSSTTGGIAQTISWDGRPTIDGRKSLGYRMVSSLTSAGSAPATNDSLYGHTIQPTDAPNILVKVWNASAVAQKVRLRGTLEEVDSNGGNPRKVKEYAPTDDISIPAGQSTLVELLTRYSGGIFAKNLATFKDVASGIVDSDPQTLQYFRLKVVVYSGSTDLDDSSYAFVVNDSSIPSHPALFSAEAPLSDGVYYLQFPSGSMFGYYSYLTVSGWIYHFDMGYEYIYPSSGSTVYMYDSKTGHWFYTGQTLFPYLYDFTLNTWIYYFPDAGNPGRYTTNPRQFAYTSNHQMFTM